MGLARPNQKHLNLVKEIIDAGKVTRGIDQCFPLRAVADAIRHVEAGHAKGRVVITVQHNGKP